MSMIYRCPKCHNQTAEEKQINFCVRCGNPLVPSDIQYQKIAEDEKRKKEILLIFIIFLVIFIMKIFSVFSEIFLGILEVFL